jgi:hypothetical protein
MLSFFGTSALALVLHETGHALAAVLTGMQIRQIRLGSGPPLYRTRIRETEIVVGCIPNSGFVKIFPQLSRRRLASFCFVLAGPGMDFALLATFAALGSAYGGYAPVDAAISTAILCLLLMLLFNLWPRKATVDREIMASDGLVLWRLTFGKDEAGQFYRDAYARILERNPANEEKQTRISKQTERILYNVLTLVFTPDPEAREVITSLERELARGLPPFEERFVLDMLVSHRLGYDTSQFRDKLDRWSSRALALDPELATLKGSRGAVLIELGRYEEALAMLDLADMSDPFNRCLVTAFRALALQKLGRSHEAIATFSDARAISKESPNFGGIAERILARVEAEIGTPAPHREPERSMITTRQ